MENLLNATDVRANFSSFIDTVVREKPQIIKRNRDIIISFSKEQIVEALSVYELNIEYEIDEDGKYAGSILQIEDIVAEGETLEALKNALSRQLLEYAKDYYSSYQRYSQAPNRASHSSYILRVLLADNLEAVAEMLSA